MTLIDEAVQRLLRLGLEAPEPYNFEPKRTRPELTASLWSVTCGMRPKAQRLLATVTCGEAAREVYALAFRVLPATVFPRVGTNASVQFRIRQYMHVREQIAAHFMTCSSRRHHARQAPTEVSTAVSNASALTIAPAFLAWRRLFEGKAGVTNDPLGLQTRIWDKSFFHDSTAEDDDWIAYCFALVFDALDDVPVLDCIYGRARVRRNAVLASSRGAGHTEVRVIAAGRWPFLDELVIEYGLRKSAPEVERMAEEACAEQRRGFEKYFAKTA